MSGIYLKIYVTEQQRHDGKLLFEWLLETARGLGIPGGTAFRAIAGYGRHGVLHEESFFELAGSLPMEVVFTASEEQVASLLAKVREAGLRLVYVCIAAQFGVTE